jgi:Fur family ferric uptake transcriptional regulator
MARKSRIPAELLRLMDGGARHAWTLEELRADLAGRAIAADFSSVFRAAQRLVAEGRVRRIDLPDGPARFEPDGAHHDHLLCVRCHALVPIPCVLDHGALRAAMSETGCVVSGHRLVLSGTCRDCGADAAVSRSAA